MMFHAKEDFLTGDPSDYAAVEETLRSGKRICLCPLRPTIRAEGVRMNPAEKILFFLSNGIMNPKMNKDELKRFLDFNPFEAIEVYNRIQRLSANTDRKTMKRNHLDPDEEFIKAIETIATIKGEK